MMIIAIYRYYVGASIVKKALSWANMHRGYVKIYRKICDSWIFENAEYFKAFFVIMSEVNHKPKEVLINSKLIYCKRGESVNCLDTWARKFGKGWTKSRVRRFLKLLEKGNMIELKSETVTTHLSVCKYDTYQGERNTDETQMKHKRNTSETEATLNKNDKNDKNDKNEKEKELELELGKPPETKITSFEEFEKMARREKERREYLRKSNEFTA